MAGVRIATDTASDLPQDIVEEYGIEIVPLTIRFGDEEFVDRFELSAEAFYEKMESSDHFPETSAPAPGLFEEAFTRLVDDGADAIVCINISSHLSATMSSAQNAAKAFDGRLPVRVVDSRSITGGQGNQVALAAKAAASGMPADEIAALVEDMADRTHVFGALNTLDNLKKGGRIGNAQALIGSMLSIKPIIDISGGKVAEAGKQRTRKKSLVWLRDKVFALDKVEHLTVCSGMAEDIDDLYELLSPRFSRDELHEYRIGATIGTHGGPGVLGLAWQNVR